MARARVLQYNALTGAGVLDLAPGRRAFTLQDWRGAQDPAVDQLVEVEQVGDRWSVTPLGAAALNMVRDKIGRRLGAQAQELWRALRARLGADVLLAYGLFAAATGWMEFAKLTFFVGVGASLYDLLGAVDQLNASKNRLWLFVAYASWLVPLAIKDARAWLSLAFPLTLLLLVLGDAWYQVHGDLGHHDDTLWRALSFKSGFYLALAAAVFLTARGCRRYWRDRHKARNQGQRNEHAGDGRQGPSQ